MSGPVVDRRPGQEVQETRVTGGRQGARGAVKAVRSFYSRQVAWGGFLFVLVTLAYGGGAVMFWLHAIYRGEAGPAIGNVQHWLLDSTLGFVALAPAVFVLLPAALWALQRRTGGGRVRLAGYVLVVGILFALVTGPGPLLHNAIAGRDTPLANAATEVFGEEQATHKHKEHSPISSGMLQVAVGIPVYSVFTLSSVMLVRATVGRRKGTGLPA